jgi:hypothetical protein
MLTGKSCTDSLTDGQRAVAVGRVAKAYCASLASVELGSMAHVASPSCRSQAQGLMRCTCRLPEWRIALSGESGGS